MVAGLGREPRVSKADQKKITQGAKNLSRRVNQTLDHELNTPVSMKNNPEVASKDFVSEGDDYYHFINRSERVEELNRVGVEFKCNSPINCNSS